MAEPLAIETVELRKHYDGMEALRGLTLAVPKGSIFGLLGRNGAGKTTTIKVLLGMARPSGGDARVFGLTARDEQASVEIRRRTGFVSDDKELYPYFSTKITKVTKTTKAFCFLTSEASAVISERRSTPDHLKNVRRDLSDLRDLRG